MSGLFKAARDAAKYGGKVQQTVRDYLADPERTVDDRLNIICNEVQAFKTWAEEHHIDNDPEKRKTVNNIINDISRICRKKEGVSIVCTKRKGGYEYEAKAATAVASTTPPPTPSVTATGWAVDDGSSFVRHNPYTALEIVLDTLTPEEFMEAVKGHNENKS